MGIEDLLKAFEQRCDELKPRHRNGECLAAAGRIEGKGRKGSWIFAFFQVGDITDFNWNDDYSDEKGVGCESETHKEVEFPRT